MERNAHRLTLHSPAGEILRQRRLRVLDVDQLLFPLWDFSAVFTGWVPVSQGCRTTTGDVSSHGVATRHRPPFAHYIQRRFRR